jgi:hypothetical protein
MRSTYWTIGYWGGFYWLPLYWPIRFIDGCPPDSEIESAYQLAVRVTTLSLDALATASLIDCEIEGILLGVTARAYGDVEVTVIVC